MVCVWSSASQAAQQRRSLGVSIAIQFSLPVVVVEWSVNYCACVFEFGDERRRIVDDAQLTPFDLPAMARAFLTMPIA